MEKHFNTITAVVVSEVPDHKAREQTHKQFKETRYERDVNTETPNNRAHQPKHTGRVTAMKIFNKP